MWKNNSIDEYSAQLGKGFMAFVLALIVCVLIFNGNTPNVPGIASDVIPAVVHIDSPVICQGSGCLISEDGILFTARHVTKGLYNDYKVTLNDGRKFNVKHIIEDRENDLAFMQLDLPAGVTVPYAELDQSRKTRVGESVLIIGSSLGIDNFNTVSSGIVSYIGREINPVHDNPFGWRAMIQSTSPAYPGNSGGPVFNMAGKVIGVLVAGMDATLNYSVSANCFSDDLDSIRMALSLSRFAEVVEEENYNGQF